MVFGIYFQITWGVGVGRGTNETRLAMSLQLLRLHGENLGAFILVFLLEYIF